MLGSCVTVFVAVELLLTMYIAACVGGFMKFSLYSFILYTSEYGIFMPHNSSLLFLSPCNIFLLFFVTISFFLFKSTSQSSLHNFPTDTNDALFSDGSVAVGLTFFPND